MKLETLNSDNATIEQAIAYLSELFKQHDTGLDTKVAYKMTSVVSCNNFDKWREDEDFDDLFSIVGGLEIPSSNTDSRKQTWKDVGNLLTKLKEKYSK